VSAPLAESLLWHRGMHISWLHVLLGGAAVGAAASLLMLGHGRVSGVSGILGAILDPATPDRGWRLAFVAGLVLGGTVAARVSPGLIGRSTRDLPVLAIAGALVGYGARLAGGCTSGHGVCGLARGSARSTVALITFTTAAAITATLGGAS
jgi:uncharacterized protein